MIRPVTVAFLGRRWTWTCDTCGETTARPVDRETLATLTGLHQCPEPTPMPPLTSQERTAAYRARKKEQG